MRGYCNCRFYKLPGSNSKLSRTIGAIAVLYILRISRRSVPAKLVKPTVIWKTKEIWINSLSSSQAGPELGCTRSNFRVSLSPFICTGPIPVASCSPAALSSQVEYDRGMDPSQFLPLSDCEARVRAPSIICHHKWNCRWPNEVVTSINYSSINNRAHQGGPWSFFDLYARNPLESDGAVVQSLSR